MSDLAGQFHQSRRIELRPWRIREYHRDDLDQLIEVWQNSRQWKLQSVHSISDIIAAAIEGPATVAFVGSQIVGAVVSRVLDDRAWVLMLAQLPEWRDQGLGSDLLSDLEKRLASRQVVRISALLPTAETRVKAFRNSGFDHEESLTYFERKMPVQPKEIDALGRLGGVTSPRGLWDEMAGMQREKELIERRLILPLARSDIAASLGVVPPRAVVLFGPPGTGKTTFAKAVASRLGWPFVEVFPSRLSSDPRGLAVALRQTFGEISKLDHAVVFIDEVEEIASQRAGDPPSPTQGVTNELLKIIPTFRAREGRLLICATNFIRALDQAFLRHGRFDYVIPIGLPDFDARCAIWGRYVPDSAAPHVNMDTLAECSEWFSPADIEFAARKASQRALEQAVYGNPVSSDGVALHTQSYLDAINQTRATAGQETVRDFLQDIDLIGRI